MAVDLTTNKIHNLMKNQTNIRNMSVIAHVDHGKSTLSDTLVIKAKIVSSSSGGDRYMDTREDEQMRGITIKSTAISLNFALDEDIIKNYLKQKYNGNDFLINLIDSPGHVDFSSEVTAALRITDGALVVVDCISGMRVQTKTVLGQAIQEKIKPILCLNKLDRALFELQETKLSLYSKLKEQVDSFNDFLLKISKHEDDPEFPVQKVDPRKSEVSFCSAKQQWGFTLRNFARFYKERYSKSKAANPEAAFCNVLWRNDCYFTSDDPFDAEATFKQDENLSKNAERVPFIVFVLNPIYKVVELCKNTDVEGVKEYLKKFGVEFGKETLPTDTKNLFQIVMAKWLPCADSILEQIIIHLPSPVVSQKYRAKYLYEGPEDPCLIAIKEADPSPEAPLMVYISKVTYTKIGFVAVGRVFSGTVKCGTRVRIQEPGFTPTSGEQRYKQIGRVILMMGRENKEIPDCPAGNIVGIIGIESALQKTATLTTYPGAFNIKSMKFTVSPVVKYSIKAKNASDLVKLNEGLDKLVKLDPLCLVNPNDNGEITVAGAGELHLEITINDLKGFSGGIDIIKGEPTVSYLEGISGETTDSKMSKSMNKHNRIYMTCEPLSSVIVDNIITGDLVKKNPKERAEIFEKILGVREDWVKKVLFYGPEDKGPNLLVDETKGVAYLNEIKEYMCNGFREVTARGPLIGDNLKGVRFNLTDLTLHSDAIHRTGNQITAPVTSVCRGLIMNSTPILYEPIYKVEISVAKAHASAAQQVIIKRRGFIEEYNDEDELRTVLIGKLPVKESFGLNQDLQTATRGEAQQVLSFSHHDELPGDWDVVGSITNKVVNDCRARRNLGALKIADAYFDRL